MDVFPATCSGRGAQVEFVRPKIEYGTNSQWPARGLLQGVMQIVAVTDPLQLGFARQAMIGIRIAGDTRGVAAHLSTLPGISYVVSTAGSFDLLVEVVCENDDDLMDLLSEQIRALPEVVSTETFVYLKLHRQLYNWGTR